MCSPWKNLALGMSAPMLVKATKSKFNGSQNIHRKKSKWEGRLGGKKGFRETHYICTHKAEKWILVLNSLSLFYHSMTPNTLDSVVLIRVGNSISVFQSKHSLIDIFRGLSLRQVDSQYFPSYCWYCPYCRQWDMVMVVTHNWNV